MADRAGTLWNELRELTRVRVLLFLREPEAIFWVFVFPLVLAAVLGFAFRGGGVPASRVALLDGPGADELVERLERSGAARAADAEEDAEAEAENGGRASLEVERFADRAAAERALRKGAVDLLIEPAAVPRLRLDPVRPESETARLRVLAALRPAPPGDGADGGEPAETEPMVVPGSRYLDFLFPGLLGMNVMGTGMWSIGFAIAELRQRKLLRRFLVTPMRRSSFLLSFFLSRLVFLFFELLVLTSFGAWVLGVPFRASVFGFLAVCLLGAFAFAALGLLTVSRVKTIQGASGIMNFVMMPMWLGSGVFFSYERFPDVLHPLLRLIPLTAMNDVLRDLMLDGRPLSAELVPLGIMAAWGVLGFAAALKLFRWE